MQLATEEATRTGTINQQFGNIKQLTNEKNEKENYMATSTRTVCPNYYNL